MIWMWDDPYNSFLVFLRVMLPALVPMVPGLLLATGARLRASRLFSGVGDPTTDGAGLASAILEAGGGSARLVVRTSGPLADFYDPWSRELRISGAVAAGRTSESLGVAAHEAGHALQDLRGSWLPKLRPPMVLGARLAAGVAWMTIVAGVSMKNPGLAGRGASLYLAVAVLLLVLLTIERDASRRSLAALPSLEAIRPAVEAAAWLDLASLLPVPRWRSAPAHRRA